MKIRFLAALLLAALAIPMLTGCAANTLQQSASLPTIPVAAAADSQNSLPDPTPAATPAATGVSHTLPGASQFLRAEEAEKIALDHAGFTAEQVQRLRTELDCDWDRSEYEVEFHVNRWEYNYEIDAETGEILSFDKEWDD